MKSLPLIWTVVVASLLCPPCARAQVPPASRPPLQQVILVFKTHFDIGYTDMASNVVKRYRTTMIDDALKVVDQNRPLPPEQQFAWTIPGWPMTKITDDWPGQTPARRQKVLEAFREGRFVVHALPFTTHTETLDLEDLVWGLTYASRLSRAVSLPLPRDAKMTDVPCHSWIMPTLLRNAGVEFLHLGCNAASSSPQVPRLFFWEGPDGSRLLTMYTAESYGTGLVPPSDWPYSTWLALIHTGDNHGPPTPQEVKALLDEAAQKLPNVKVRIGRLSDFADAILAEKSDVPVVRGDMPDTWIHGPMSNPQGAKLARNVRPAIAITESLNTLLNAWGVPVPGIADTLAKAREQSLLYGEHTWGGAQYWVTQYGAGTKWSYGEGWKADQQKGRFQRLEDSWAEHTAYIETARNLIEPMLRAELLALAHPDTNATQERSVFVYNPLPWSRRGRTFAADCAHRHFLPYCRLQPPLAGSQVSAMSRGNSFEFISSEIPPMGYMRYEVIDAGHNGPALVESRKETATLETPRFRVVLDPARGTIRSLVHKPSKRELVDSAAAQGFGQMLYERFSAKEVASYVKDYVKIQADWAVNELGKPAMPPAEQVPYRAASPQRWKCDYEQSPFSASAILHADSGESVPFGVTTRVTVFADQDYVDVELTVHNKPADPWPEAAWFCLPFQVDSPQFRLGRQGSIVDPAKDLVPGANHNLYAVDTGLAIFSSEGPGVGICALDSPLVSLEAPGCWKYSRDFVPKKPVVFINLFNNQWTTNFRMWNQGTWTTRFRIWAFDRFDPERDLIRPSLEARYPLQGVVVDGAGGTQPDRGIGLTLDRKGVLVTAFGRNPDGPGTRLRLWELVGKAGPCAVRLPAGLKIKSAQPVNLRGQPQGAAIVVRENAFETPLRAFAPASFVLE